MVWRSAWEATANGFSVISVPWKLTSSRCTQMRELRTQSGGKPLRTLYAFDPRRYAILLIGGDKTGDDRWNEKFVLAADRLFEKHLLEIEKEGTT